MTESLITFILAGGRSSRMGTDKADIKVGGHSMLERACRLATRIGSDRVCVLGRPDHELGVADETPFEGPARALAAQLEDLPVPTRILVLPVDMPLLEPRQINALLSHDHGCHFDRMYLPFTALLTRPVRFDGDRVRDLVELLGVASVPSNPAWSDALQNINTPDMLARVEQHLKDASFQAQGHGNVI